MIPLVQSELPSLKFRATSVPEQQRIKAQSSKIGWLHSLAKPGTRFDIRIKDALGRVKYERKGFGGEADKFGELINFPTLVGEELDIEVENIQGSEEIDIFVN